MRRLVWIVVAGAVSAVGMEERVLVEQLRERIAAQPAPQLASVMETYAETIPGTDASFTMLPIPAGEFLMGSPPDEPGRADDEGPQRRVSIEPFWMAKTETTWNLYRLFMFSEMANERGDEVVDAVSRPTPPYVEMSFGMGVDGYPAISMTQHAAAKFTQWLSARTNRFYRLPTEAEWEYACRAGASGPFSFGDDASRLGEYAWYWDNADVKYHQAGGKKPNPWGLHDMHGNVMEWTLDAYGRYPRRSKSAEALASPWIRPKTLYPRVARGGSWADDPEKLRCAARVASSAQWKMQDPQLPKSVWYHTDAQWLGFRVVRPLRLPPVAEMDAYWNSGLANE